MTHGDDVAAIVREIREDRESGATQLTARALDALELEARVEGPPALQGERFKRLVCELDGARPAMGAIGAGALMAWARAAGHVRAGSSWSEAMLAAVRQERDAMASAEELVVARVRGVLGRGRVVGTCSFSSSALRGILASEPAQVRVAEGGRLGDGARATRWLAARGVDTVLVSDSAMARATEGCDAVVIGADQILRGGAVVNRTGSLGLALAASHFGVPFYVACVRTKLTGRDGFDAERAGSLFDERANGAPDLDPLFETVEAALVTRVLSDSGELSIEDIVTAGERMAELRRRCGLV